MTTYQYDDGGRLVSSVTVREPEFSDWDRALLLDDHAKRSVRIGGHGVPLSEATDPANRYAFDVPRNDKGIPKPATDWAQKALDAAQEQYRKAYPDEPMSSKLWRVERNASVVSSEEELGATEG